MRKKVVKVKELPSLRPGQRAWYRLQLECGHTTYRQKNPLNGPPGQAQCALCLRRRRRAPKEDSE